MFLTNTRVRQILGGLWLLDGLLQLQPRMFTTALIDTVMAPALQGQPAPVAHTLTWVVQLTASHLLLANLLIAAIQMTLGICLLTGYRVEAALIASLVWSVTVWYAGEGLGMLLTGQASPLTGAPGAVLLYAALALALLPRRALLWLAAQLRITGRDFPWLMSKTNVLSRAGLRWTLAGYWLLAALLQLQPAWWRPSQIAQTIQGVESPGVPGSVLINPPLQWLAGATSGIEVPLNAALIMVCVSLAAGLALATTATQRRRLLLASIALSLLFWWATQAFGMMFSGLATDPNSGPLLALIALCCWPREAQRPSHALRARHAPDAQATAAARLGAQA